MDTEELRKACEMAGLEWDDSGFKATHGFVAHKSYRRGDGSTVTPIYQLDDPALPAYVASLLVAMVRDSVLDIRELYVMQFANNSEAIDATDEQRIRAAMAVLEKDDGP